MPSYIEYRWKVCCECGTRATAALSTNIQIHTQSEAIAILNAQTQVTAVHNLF